MINKRLVLSFLLAITVSANLSGNTNKGHIHTDEYYEELKGKYKDEHLTIHLLPHSHDDVGWLKTVDMYYIGSN